MFKAQKIRCLSFIVYLIALKPVVADAQTRRRQEAIAAHWSLCYH